MTEEIVANNFIHEIIEEDLRSGRHTEIVTRFPPEPNGYLHIGHAKSICLNFGTALKYNGRCHMRFDDTNPAKEDIEYVDSILEDIKWLGFDWGEHLYYAADYFDQMYEYAVELVGKGLAYACKLTPEEFKEYRGVPTEPGKDSPFRNTAPEKNLKIFKDMKDGVYDDGEYVIRAKINMASPNLHMRDPAIYRIKKASHHRTGDKWCIYPMYDFAHCIEDAIEKITHSICTLEFEVHRPLYDWILDNISIDCHPRQYEFARLNLTYTVMSKRKLLQLVEENFVKGWDDPRMPTIAGLRRRGYTAASIREFCRRIGVTKFDSMTDIALLEYCVREELNVTSDRYMGVLDPLKVVIENYPEDHEEILIGTNNPMDENSATREIPFSREIYIERSDFMENPPNKFHRLGKPGKEVRLRYGYFIAFKEAIKDEDGNVVELRCTYDPETKGGNAPDGRKVRGTIHWVSVNHAYDAEIRLYDRLFDCETPDDNKDGSTFLDHLYEGSLKIINAKVEPAAKLLGKAIRIQFERTGYFYVDHIDSVEGVPVFNQIVPLRHTFVTLSL
jgi:glutaminyl-tRNA synthetase